ncbi:hypothetical protein Tco_0610269 [Tanacetum coccineum]
MKGWKYKDLKSKDFDSIKELFDKASTRVNMFVDFRTELVEGSSKRSGEELEQESTKKPKVDEDKDASELQTLMEVIPDEEEVAIDVVPLATKSPSIVDWKIHKKGKKSYYQIVGSAQSHDIATYKAYSISSSYTIVKIKSLLNAASITAVLIDVNAAQSKLVLLENFNENYSKFNAAKGVNAASKEVSAAELLKEFDLLKWDQQVVSELVEKL